MQKIQKYFDLRGDLLRYPDGCIGLVDKGPDYPALVKILDCVVGRSYLQGGSLMIISIYVVRIISEKIYKTAFIRQIKGKGKKCSRKQTYTFCSPS